MLTDPNTAWLGPVALSTAYHRPLCAPGAAGHDRQRHAIEPHLGPGDVMHAQNAAERAVTETHARRRLHFEVERCQGWRQQDHVGTVVRLGEVERNLRLGASGNGADRIHDDLSVAYAREDL